VASFVRFRRISNTRVEGHFPHALCINFYYCEAFMNTYNSKSVPAKWPFPPHSGRNKKPQKISRGTMVADICLVAVWGAMIPGLMWLGVAVGF
jgi:hypothetical protein